MKEYHEVGSVRKAEKDIMVVWIIIIMAIAKGVFVKRNNKEIKPENREDKKIIKNRDFTKSWAEVNCKVYFYFN